MKEDFKFNITELENDEMDFDDEPVTLDSWKPRKFESKIIPSKWRLIQNKGNQNQMPGLDDLKKIQLHIKKKISDLEIMSVFAISAETLIAIKKDKYDPVDGISLDNQSKIYNEFKRIENKVDSILRAIEYMSDIMFPEKIQKDNFKKSFKKPKKYKPDEHED
jgi:hypothetical protein